jgi:hypothetical protein
MNLFAFITSCGTLQLSAGPHVTFLDDFEDLLEQVLEEHRNLFPEVT